MPKGIHYKADVGEPRFLDEEEFTQMRSLFHDRMEKEGLSYLRYYIEGHTRDNESLVRVSEDIRNHSHRAEDTNALLKDFRTLIGAMHETAHWLYGMEFFTPAFDEYARAALMAAKPGMSAEEAAALLMEVAVPSHKLPFQSEKEAILGIDLDDTAAIMALHAQYAWLSINFWNGTPFTLDEYHARIATMKQGLLLETQVKETDAAMERAQSIIAGETDTFVRELLSSVLDLVHLKTWRIDTYSISYANIRPFFAVIAERIGVPFDDLQLLTEDEVPAVLEGEPLPPNLPARRRHAIMVIEGHTHYFYGQAVDQIEAILYKDTYSGIRELKGTTGFRGVVRGKVKVLLTDRELGKLDKGDILVANLTNPNYDPAFGIVAGVITDEGGILCHSAIMAREFRIPCIIGTKIATRALKDGDMVEVDATMGVVRIIR